MSILFMVTASIAIGFMIFMTATKTVMTYAARLGMIFTHHVIAIASHVETSVRTTEARHFVAFLTLVYSVILAEIIFTPHAFRHNNRR